jgi:hypothetical protein
MRFCVYCIKKYCICIELFGISFIFYFCQFGRSIVVQQEIPLAAELINFCTAVFAGILIRCNQSIGVRQGL